MVDGLVVFNGNDALLSDLGVARESFNAHIVFQSYFFEVAAKVLSVKPVVFFGLSGHGVLSYMMKVMLVKV